MPRVNDWDSPSGFSGLLGRKGFNPDIAEEMDCAGHEEENTRGGGEEEERKRERERREEEERRGEIDVRSDV